jgi:hypothetical protein
MWEYKVYESELKWYDTQDSWGMPSKDCYQSPISGELLNQLGSEGWELTHMDSNYQKAIFKRKKPNPEEDYTC